MIFINNGYKADNNIIFWYSLGIESLIYVMIMTWSDLIYLFLVLSRYCFSSNSTYSKIVMRILKYVKEILNFDIHYQGKEMLIE